VCLVVNGKWNHHRSLHFYFLYQAATPIIKNNAFGCVPLLFSAIQDLSSNRATEVIYTTFFSWICSFSPGKCRDIIRQQPCPSQFIIHKSSHLRFDIAASRTTQTTQFYCCVAQATQKTSHVITISPVHWRADCCLVTNY
jgi:hypothetical protein